MGSKCANRRTTLLPCCACLFLKGGMKPKCEKTSQSKNMCQISNAEIFKLEQVREDLTTKFLLHITPPATLLDSQKGTNKVNSMIMTLHGRQMVQLLLPQLSHCGQGENHVCSGCQTSTALSGKETLRNKMGSCAYAVFTRVLCHSRRKI